MRQSARLLDPILIVPLTAAAIFVLGACFVAIYFRYDFGVGGGDAGAYRFDRWTGEATICLPKPENPLRLSCSGRSSDWMAVPAK